MVELRTEDPRTSDQLCVTFANLGFVAPFREADADPGVIVDSTGETLCVVDTNNQIPDEQARALALMIILCVNTCCGFRAVAPEGTPNDG